MQEQQRLWLGLQERQARTSRRGRVVHCPKPCDHGLPYSSVDFVVATIDEFLVDTGVVARA